MAQLRMIPATRYDRAREKAAPARARNGRVLFYEGDRLYLRPIELADEFLLLKWVNDPAVRQGLEHRPPVNGFRERAWIEEQGQNPSEYHFGIVVRAGDRLIGTISLVDMHPIDRSAELRIMIGEADYRGKGLGTETVRLVIRYGFEELNLNRIELGVYADNARAIRCYEKAGFVHEGRLRQSLYRHGRFVDEYVFGILKEDWLKSRTTLNRPG